MLHVQQHIDTAATGGLTATETLTLPFDQRQKSRFRAALDSGVEIAVHLPRGTVLRGGDLLRAGDETLVRVQAAPEPVSTIRSDDARELTRAAYHLGNRHVQLQVGDGWLRYQHDHVLDEMVKRLGLAVICEQAPFEPESGAYAGGHHHHHDHGHAHPREHEHEHEHAHHGDAAHG